MQSLLRDQDKFDAGREKEKVEIAEKMIKRGDSTEEITEITDLSEQEVLNLKEGALLC